METKIRAGTDISEHRASDACNAKPVMEVLPQTAIDVKWDSVSLSRQMTKTGSTEGRTYNMQKNNVIRKIIL